MKCPGCNSTIPEGVSFCPECGQKIEMDFPHNTGRTYWRQPQKPETENTSDKKAKKASKKKRNGYGNSHSSAGYIYRMCHSCYIK